MSLCMATLLAMWTYPMSWSKMAVNILALLRTEPENWLIRHGWMCMVSGFWTHFPFHVRFVRCGVFPIWCVYRDDFGFAPCHHYWICCMPWCICGLYILRRMSIGVDWSKWMEWKIQCNNSYVHIDEFILMLRVYEKEYSRERKKKSSTKAQHMTIHALLDALFTLVV